MRRATRIYLRNLQLELYETANYLKSKALNGSLTNAELLQLNVAEEKLSVVNTVIDFETNYANN